jgi:CheY-like chemotaxis protein
MSYFGLRAAKDQRPRVLYVDDDPLLLKAFSRTVGSAGWKVDVAGDAGAALALSRLHVYDVIVADHHMPQMTGEQLIAHLRPLQAQASYVVVTGHADLAVASCKTPGLFVVISKPWDTETLLNILTACRRRRDNATTRRQSA